MYENGLIGCEAKSGIAGCESTMKGQAAPKDPLLRERLERVVGILESAQGATNFIMGKLFRPTVEENGKCPDLPDSYELEALIEKADIYACRLEADLNLINEKL